MRIRLLCLPPVPLAAHSATTTGWLVQAHAVVYSNAQQKLRSQITSPAASPVVHLRVSVERMCDGMCVCVRLYVRLELSSRWVTLCIIRRFALGAHTKKQMLCIRQQIEDNAHRTTARRF